MDDNRTDYLVTAASLVSAYVANNSLPSSELPGLITSVHSALVGLANGVTAQATAAADVPEKATPAQIRKSVTPDALISFLDGKTYKTLKRHLTTHGLDPNSYRQRYGLPSDYPMVSANYAAQRSQLAKAIGLGRPGSLVKDSPAAADTAELAPAKASRGRPKAVKAAPEAVQAPETPVRAAARRSRKDPTKAAA